MILHNEPPLPADRQQAANVDNHLNAVVIQISILLHSLFRGLSALSLAQHLAPLCARAGSYNWRHSYTSPQARIDILLFSVAAAPRSSPPRPLSAQTVPADPCLLGPHFANPPLHKRRIQSQAPALERHLCLTDQKRCHSIRVLSYPQMLLQAEGPAQRRGPKPASVHWPPCRDLYCARNCRHLPDHIFPPGSTCRVSVLCLPLCPRSCHLLFPPPSRQAPFPHLGSCQSLSACVPAMRAFPVRAPLNLIEPTLY
jgi:hypothetical protein